MKRRVNYRVRRLVFSLLLAGVSAFGAIYLKSAENSNQETLPAIEEKTTQNQSDSAAQDSDASMALSKLEVKGRAPKTDYRRVQFGDGWQKHTNGCDTRNEILRRDLQNIEQDKNCKVIRGTLTDPYTAKVIEFERAQGSDKVQIDHVVALSNAWQTGAQALSLDHRIKFANDPLNLLAVDGSANQQKGDADAASWLPPNRSFRCAYIARQILVKKTYNLWVTKAEKSAMERVLASCPGQKLPTA